MAEVNPIPEEEVTPARENPDTAESAPEEDVDVDEATEEAENAEDSE